ncbi:hypothetical protein FB45DRAFT_355413 [Roridomyces roridus]|uniref:F-box domain-containing protein n=1 Tax=Roridomyces roridus TaxID=1738132 RepID=A0AAD7C9E4_9AGAR|nr:hypothetical protein FB45DRAFT_355413 [Roridomyces roridus]
MARLPLEVSSEIFVQCLPEYPRPQTHTITRLVPPLLFLRICFTWNQIALSTPTLWSKMVLESPYDSKLEALAERWLQRARSRPLHISFWRSNVDTRIGSLIWGYRSQLKCLKLNVYNDMYDELDEEDEYAEFRLLFGIAQPEPLPFLRTLDLSGLNSGTLSPLPIIQLLRIAPNLSQLSFCNLALAVDAFDEQLALPNLRRLAFVREDPELDEANYELLDFISAPGLEQFTLDLDFGDEDDIISFLQRSSPPLLALEISGTENLYSFDILLSLVPSLTRLRIKYPDSLAQDLFSALAQTPISVLPNLRDLELESAHDSDVLWDIVVRALRNRREQIKRFRLSDSWLEIPPHVLATLRDLVAEGMEMWIQKTSGLERNINMVGTV